MNKRIFPPLSLKRSSSIPHLPPSSTRKSSRRSFLFFFRDRPKRRRSLVSWGAAVRLESSLRRGQRFPFYIPGEKSSFPSLLFFSGSPFFVARPKKKSPLSPSFFFFPFPSLRLDRGPRRPLFPCAKRESEALSLPSFPWRR